jgi:hypothetical protein
MYGRNSLTDDAKHCESITQSRESNFGHFPNLNPLFPWREVQTSAPRLTALLQTGNEVACKYERTEIELLPSIYVYLHIDV